MSEQRLNMVPTEEMVRLVISLENNEDFQALMKQMEARSDGLAVWACLVEDEVKLRWAQGRVTEMQDWLRLWHGRRSWKQHFETQRTAADDGVQGGGGILV